MADDVGKLLLNTKDEIKHLKTELEMLQNPFTMASPIDYKQMLNKIQTQISQFEEKISSKVDSLSYQRIQTYDDSTLNKLPNIQKQVTLVKDRNAKSLSTMTSPSFQDEKQITTPKKLDPRSVFWMKLASNPTSTVTKKMLQEKYSLPLPSPSSMKSPTSLKPLQKQKLVGKISKPVGILPKIVRENPFAAVSIETKDMQQGMLGLINRGMLPNEIDLTPVFERGSATLASQKIKLHYHEERFIKTESTRLPTYMTNARFDTKTFEQTAVSEFKLTSRSKPSYQSNYQSTYQSTQSTQQPEQLTLSPEVAPKSYKFEEPSAKDYDGVLDAYSLHQFIIRKGKALVDTPEFQSYNRTYFGIWDSVKVLIDELEKILSDYDIKVAYVDGKKLGRLAEISFKKPKMDELLSCVTNYRDIERALKAPQKKFKGANGDRLAAVKIQSCMRMYRIKKAYKQTKVIKEKVLIIQKIARLYIQHKKTIQKIKEKREQYNVTYQELDQKLQQDWSKIKQERRVEIHIQSLDYDEFQRLSSENFAQKQNTQIARLFALKDPLVDIIYVAPFELPPEVINYYSRVFEFGGLEGYQERYNILWPENHKTFPSYFPTTRILMYSPQTLKKIKQLIQGKNAYIVPSTPSTDYIQLAAMLNVPLLSGNPQESILYSTKSGAKALFNECDLPVAPSLYNIYDEKELMLSLARLIAHNFYVNTWIFKINDEYSGRGHASFNIESIRPLTELRNQKLPANEGLVMRVHEIVSNLLPHKIKITMPHLYKTYTEYIARFAQKGGVIEAAPNCPSSQVMSTSIGFLVDPVGQVEVLGSYDKFFAHDYTSCGYFFPQKSVPNLNLQMICDMAGKKMYEKGIYGYATLDIVSFPYAGSNSKNEKEKFGDRIFWAVDLDCCMTSAIAATMFFEFLMCGKHDSATGAYTIVKPVMGMSQQIEENGEAEKEKEKENEKERERRCFMYCPYVYHPGLFTVQYKNFFHLCRMKGISYDLESKTGTTFVLLDSLQAGIMGLVTMGKHRGNTIKYMNEALSFILSQAGSSEFKGARIVITQETLHLSEIVGKVKAMNKAAEKKANKA